MVLGLKFSLSYFSILPIKFKKDDDLSKESVLFFMLIFFPLVGLIISLLTLLFISFGSNWLYFLFGALFFMILYGFLHTEAVIDVVDALFAKHSQKSPYEVIKEPTVGAMGVLFGVAFLILKIATLTYLFLEQKGLFLVAVAVGSRVGALVIFRAFEFKSSFLTLLKSSFSKKGFIFSLIFYTALVGFIVGEYGVLIVFFEVIVALILAKIIKNSLGFINGDGVGAAIEGSELLGLTLVTGGGFGLS